MLQGTLDRTIMFSAGDELMDETQSHTVNIASGSLAHMSQKQTIGNSPSQKDQNQTGPFQAKSKVTGHKVNIEMIDLTFFNLFAIQCSDPRKMNPQQIRFDGEDDCRDKAVRFFADDACMDVTHIHTVNSATHNLCSERGRLKNAEMGLPNHKGKASEHWHL